MYPPVTVAPVLEYDPPDNVPPERDPPERVDPLIVPKLVIVGVPDPMMLPVSGEGTDSISGNCVHC